MEKQPIKLSDGQHRELREIAKVLTSNYQIEKVICFGALSSMTTANTCFMPPDHSTKNTYYLLVLTTETKRIEYVMQDFISSHFPGVFIIAHGVSTVMEAVYRYDRFFVDACLNGLLVYTSDGFAMTPEFVAENIEDSYLKDEEAFSRMYSMASGFLESALDCFEKGFFNNVAFLLHQSVEQACRGLIRLYTGYRADIHNIDRLLFLCECFSAEPAMLFKRHFKEDKRLFRVLAGSYTEARYRDNYEVGDQDGDKLCSLVKAFLDLTLKLSSKVPHEVTARTTVEEQAAVVDYSPAQPVSL
ncbi:HEPN domain-containing protein [Mucilaginibacter ginsenosidivorax]|uniref:HEPN domain-containing protein n=1 Tax=Mucilaginibacter ginsenosidivorax TaxID=862126 RepID=A0A5B8W045_9SPHI|nr:HEPN domain-containing protein [Mucilaginibacter ginsenosidivorax]QEC77277.1 HEPN domain-containing protein [Mucilaginibacter ginsenosidivorax]